MLGVTFDGLSVNRRLIKIHDLSSKFLNKVKNVYASDDQYIFFFLTHHTSLKLRGTVDNPNAVHYGYIIINDNDN